MKLNMMLLFSLLILGACATPQTRYEPTSPSERAAFGPGRSQ